VTTTVLVLGGTTEGRELAAALDGRPGLQVVTSLAGRVQEPLPLAGPVRSGGFGGVDGLVAWLRAHHPALLVDATHPYATRITGAAAQAAARAQVPALRLARPGWTPQVGDRWHRVPDAAAAAAVLPALGSRPLLTTGHGGLPAFLAADGCARLPVLLRCVEPVAEPLPAPWRVLLARGPFTVEGERELLHRERIDVLVTRDSGGSAAKLDAAREAGTPVVVLDRPRVASGDRALPQVPTVAAALAWIDGRGVSCAPPRRSDGCDPGPGPAAQAPPGDRQRDRSLSRGGNAPMFRTIMHPVRHFHGRAPGAR